MLFICIVKIIIGLETIQQRRGQKTDKPVLLNGPGKVSTFFFKFLMQSSVGTIFVLVDDG